MNTAETASESFPEREDAADRAAVEIGRAFGAEYPGEGTAGQREAAGTECVVFRDRFSNHPGYHETEVHGSGYQEAGEVFFDETEYACYPDEEYDFAGED